MGAAGTAVAAVIFLALTVLGVVIAMKGRETMIWVVSVCALVFGTLAGAMIGILVFNSIIIMIIPPPYYAQNDCTYKINYLLLQRNCRWSCC